MYTEGKPLYKLQEQLLDVSGPRTMRREKQTCLGMEKATVVVPPKNPWASTVVLVQSKMKLCDFVWTIVA